MNFTGNANEECAISGVEVRNIDDSIVSIDGSSDEWQLIVFFQASLFQCY